MLGKDNENLGILPLAEAIRRAEGVGLDLIEVSGNAKPPVTCIADYGKYQYEQNKLKKKWQEQDKEKGKVGDDLKSTQVKPGTSQGTMEMRSKKIGEWITRGHRVKIDLFLFGRYKSMDEDFLKARLQHFLDMIPVTFVTLEEIKRSPKGYSTVIHASKKK